jgi:phosphoribosylamine--glycine ligase
VNGVVNAFTAAGLKIWGPTQYAAQLEGSKAFAKDFLARPQHPYRFLQGLHRHRCRSGLCARERRAHRHQGRWPGGGQRRDRGDDAAEAEEAITDMLSGNAFGSAGSRVVVEQFLDGEEASFIVMVDGTHALPMATSQDHKRIGDADTGPNTGGMGAYSPAPWSRLKCMHVSCAK